MPRNTRTNCLCLARYRGTFREAAIRDKEAGSDAGRLLLCALVNDSQYHLDSHTHSCENSKLAKVCGECRYHFPFCVCPKTQVVVVDREGKVVGGVEPLNDVDAGERVERAVEPMCDGREVMGGVQPMTDVVSSEDEILRREGDEGGDDGSDSRGDSADMLEDGTVEREGAEDGDDGSDSGGDSTEMERDEEAREGRGLKLPEEDDPVSSEDEFLRWEVEEDGDDGSDSRGDSADMLAMERDERAGEGPRLKMPEADNAVGGVEPMSAEGEVVGRVQPMTDVVVVVSSEDEPVGREGEEDGGDGSDSGGDSTEMERDEEAGEGRGLKLPEEDDPFVSTKVEYSTKRPLHSMYLGKHNKPLLTVTGSNGNVQLIADPEATFYVAGYVSKKSSSETNDALANCVQMVTRRLERQHEEEIRKRLTASGDLNDDSSPESSTSAGGEGLSPDDETENTSAKPNSAEDSLPASGNPNDDSSPESSTSEGGEQPSSDNETENSSATPHSAEEEKRLQEEAKRDKEEFGRGLGNLHAGWKGLSKSTLVGAQLAHFYGLGYDSHVFSHKFVSAAVPAISDFLEGKAVRSTITMNGQTGTTTQSSIVPSSSTPIDISTRGVFSRDSSALALHS